MTKKLLIYVGSAVCILAVAGVLAVYGILAGSTPLLNGTFVDAAVPSAVTIDRDDMGVPTISSSSRAAMAYATGFVHAQERFFQMDMLRRLAGGSVSELLGDSWSQEDHENRVHQFERVAGQVYQTLPAAQRDLIAAYSEGVNAGLGQLTTRPLEYYVLSVDAKPWQPKDTLLVVMAFYIQLQGYANNYEKSLDWVDREYGRAFADFLTPPHSAWNAPLDVDRDVASLQTVSIPMPGHATSVQGVSADRSDVDVKRINGSNAWLVSAARSERGQSLLANDMHLRLGTPNIFYKISLQPQSGLRVTGITIPGLPFVLAGSNGRIAWGLTNAMIDSSDLVKVHKLDADHYETANGPAAYERVTGEIVNTRWGPIVGQDLALHWTAHLPEAYNFELVALETAENVERALRIAQTTGFPHLNFLVADRDGHIGWTVLGRLPKRVGLSGKYPVQWNETTGWQGWLTPEEYPVIVNPEQGLLWSANSAPLEGAGLEKLGAGSPFDEGVRARLISSALRQHPKVSVAASMALQLDTRSLYMRQWQHLFLSLLTAPRIEAEPDLAGLKAAVMQWSGRATADSAAYRLVRRFQQRVERQVGRLLVGDASAALTNFDLEVVHPDAVWAVLQEKPAKLLPEGAADWESYLYGILHKEVFLQYQGQYESFSDVTWGEINHSRVRHPLSGALPFIASLFDMPEVAIPGDSYAVLNHFQDFGPALRMTLLPGREPDSVMTMPVGEASNPLTPYYGAGHQAWLEGQSLPLLPGKRVYTLELRPSG